jgi:hypothetical protein
MREGALGPSNNLTKATLRKTTPYGLSGCSLWHGVCCQRLFPFPANLYNRGKRKRETTLSHLRSFASLISPSIILLTAPSIIATILMGPLGHCHKPRHAGGSERIQEELRSSGMPRGQAYTIASGMGDAYRNAKRYASTVLFVLINFSLGGMLVIAFLPEEKARRNTEGPSQTCSE